MKSYKENFKENLFQKDLARILKSKRLEQGRNLEEVASGICSVSYLSRIENNQVKIQEPYLHMLFEKLKIDYNELKTSRNSDYCVEFLKKKLLNLEQIYDEMYIKIVNSNNYLDIEQHLIILYDDIINKKYHEAEILMEKIDHCQIKLSSLEQQFYQYVISLFYYETGQNKMSYRQLKTLVEDHICDEILYWCIFELYLNVLYEIGKFNTYVKNVNYFIQNAGNNYFYLHKIKHHFMYLSLESKENYLNCIRQINEYYDQQKLVDVKIKKYYELSLSMAYLYNQEYRKAYKILKTMDKNTKVITLLLICIINMNSNDIEINVINEITTYNVSDYEDLIRQLREYAILKNTHSFNVVKLQVLIKNKIINLLNQYYNSFLYQEIVKETLSLSIRCSKYKEGCYFIFGQLTNNVQNDIY